MEHHCIVATCRLPRLYGRTLSDFCPRKRHARKWRIQKKDNHLIEFLPAAEYARWDALLDEDDLVHGQVIYEAGSTSSHVYFPTAAIISLLYVMTNGASAEIAVVGKEGLVGNSATPAGASGMVFGLVFPDRVMNSVRSSNFRRVALVSPPLPLVQKQIAPDTGILEWLSVAPFLRLRGEHLALPHGEVKRRLEGHQGAVRLSLGQIQTFAPCLGARRFDLAEAAIAAAFASSKPNDSLACPRA